MSAIDYGVFMYRKRKYVGFLFDGDEKAALARGQLIKDGSIVRFRTSRNGKHRYCVTSQRMLYRGGASFQNYEFPVYVGCWIMLNQSGWWSAKSPELVAKYTRVTP